MAGDRRTFALTVRVCSDRISSQIKQRSPPFPKPLITTHLKPNNDRLFCQSHQIFKAIATTLLIDDC
ncbi:hypothetical protein [Pseudanabaena minima]|uniref:hypothetical protein n=1 Tax=Pseudanabaena minima TaxID=890415 RepID=UPI003DA92E45